MLVSSKLSFSTPTFLATFALGVLNRGSDICKAAISSQKKNDPEIIMFYFISYFVVILCKGSGAYVW